MKFCKQILTNLGFTNIKVPCAAVYPNKSYLTFNDFAVYFVRGLPHNFGNNKVEARNFTLKLEFLYILLFNLIANGHSNDIKVLFVV